LSAASPLPCGTANRSIRPAANGPFGQEKARQTSHTSGPRTGRTGFRTVHSQPKTHYHPGDQAIAAFIGAYPNNNIRRGATYLDVQREQDGQWHTVANDGDWSTKFHWKRQGTHGSK